MAEFDGSAGRGLKLAGSAAPSGAASGLSTTEKQVSFDLNVFPRNGSKGRPVSIRLRAVGAALTLKMGDNNQVGSQYIDGEWTLPLRVSALWQGLDEWHVTGGGTAALEYVIDYEVNPDAGRR